MPQLEYWHRVRMPLQNHNINKLIAELRLYSFIPNNNIKLMEKLGAFMK